MNLLTVDQLAAWLGVSRRTVYRLKDAGELPPPLHVRGCLRWHSGVVSEWLRCGAPNVHKTGWVPSSRAFDVAERVTGGRHE